MSISQWREQGYGGSSWCAPSTKCLLGRLAEALAAAYLRSLDLVTAYAMVAAAIGAVSGAVAATLAEDESDLQIARFAQIRRAGFCK